jgi:hypothetical protein
MAFITRFESELDDEKNRTNKTLKKRVSNFVKKTLKYGSANITSEPIISAKNITSDDKFNHIFVKNLYNYTDNLFIAQINSNPINEQKHKMLAFNKKDKLLVDNTYLNDNYYKATLILNHKTGLVSKQSVVKFNNPLLE